MPGNWTFTVSQLNEYVRRQLAADPMLAQLRIRGELSGFKRHFSGHLYFSLKDSQARVQCVMFKQAAGSLTFEPKDGMQVTIEGSASLFVRDGSYQVYVNRMTQQGVGELYERFEALKGKLMAEGLFDAALKKPLPFLPRRIGIITSRSGAAFHDMVKVIRRRYPDMGILLRPALVQGEGAAHDIAQALQQMDGRVDVILLGRGGGSIEDLWAFNEEEVARAIARAQTPVVSCVGHEVDVTIADFVADVRAATPSVAAELATPEKAELSSGLMAMRARLSAALAARVQNERSRVDRYARSAIFKSPGEVLIRSRREAVTRLSRSAGRALSHRIDVERSHLKGKEAALIALNPLRVLHRGYALALKDGAPVTHIDGLAPGDRVELKLAGGAALTEIQSIRRENEHG